MCRYRLYLDLIEWFENKKKQSSQKVSFNSTYKQAHDFFHQGNYSAGIKFSTLCLQDISKNKNYEVHSFICNTFLYLGEFEYCREGIQYLKNNKSTDITVELRHIY